MKRRKSSCNLPQYAVQYFCKFIQDSAPVALQPASEWGENPREKVTVMPAWTG